MLERKFGDNEHPKYVVKELSEKDELEEWVESRLKVFNTVNGSNKFQVIVFKPSSKTISAAERIYLCTSCKANYGSCALFQQYDLSVETLKETHYI